MLVNHGRRPICMRGFTLVELMVTVSVLAILVGLALPSFHDFVAKQRVRNASFQLMAALMQTRSQAITQSGTVSLKRSGSTWNSGWAVTDDTNTFGRQESLARLNISDSSNLSAVAYGRDGRLASGATKFTVKPIDATNDAATHCIKIDLSGLPTSVQGACS